MSDEILSLIYTFSKKFSDPETNLSFDPKNQNISAVVKEGNVNISLLVKGQKEDLYLNIARLLKNNVEQISGILSVNVIICLLYTSPSPRDDGVSRMPSSA